MNFSKTTFFSLLYLFIGALMFNIIFIFNAAQELNYQNRLLADQITHEIIYYSKDRKNVNIETIKNIIQKSLHIRHENNVILLSHDNKVLFSSISDQVRITRIVNNIVLSRRETSSFLDSNYIYYISYIPSSYEDFKDYNINISDASKNNFKRFTLITIVPINRIFENSIFIFINSYFILYALFLLYSAFHVRYYENRQ